MSENGEYSAHRGRWELWGRAHPVMGAAVTLAVRTPWALSFPGRVPSIILSETFEALLQFGNELLTIFAAEPSNLGKSRDVDIMSFASPIGIL